MRHQSEGIRPIAALAATALSVVYAIVVATGTLTISLGLIALANDTSFVEYYQYVFPRLRGGAAHIHMPVAGYWTFVIYIGIAATVAVHARKRIEDWSRRRGVQ